MISFQERTQLLQERLITFALSIITVTKDLKGTQENKIISVQIIRSATSIGANYTEANNAISKLDFRNKIFIAKKEAAETKYWLEILKRVNGIPLEAELREVQEILMILQKIVSTLKNGK